MILELKSQININDCYDLLCSMKNGRIYDANILIEETHNKLFLIRRKRLYRGYLAPSFKGTFIKNENETIIRGIIKKGISIPSEVGIVLVAANIILILTNLSVFSLGNMIYVLVLSIALLSVSLGLIWYGNKVANKDVDLLVNSISKLFDVEQNKRQWISYALMFC